VVIGMRDPNPLVDGRGIQELERAGVDVVVGVLEEECRELNPAYLKHLATGLPWVTLKAMLSLDGRLATESGESRGLGGSAEIRAAHRLRAESDAVVAGIGTVLADDPLLTVRGVRGGNPARVILDSSLRIPAGARIWDTLADAPLVSRLPRVTRRGTRELVERGASVWTFEPGSDGRVPLRASSVASRSKGGSRSWSRGAQVHTAFLREGRGPDRDRHLAPYRRGRTAPILTGDLGRPRLADAIQIEDLTVKRLGPDVWLTGRIAADGGPRV
jgi:diaminohydroxyphosphoribosylaminopyrimidine deaminase/5-amino-6-(5-phosphoribosylamino)uracil reductase